MSEKKTRLDGALYAYYYWRSRIAGASRRWNRTGRCDLDEHRVYGAMVRYWQERVEGGTA